MIVEGKRVSRGLEKLRERRDGEDAVGRPSERLDFLYQMLGIKNTKRICESQRVEDKTRVTTPWGTRCFPVGWGSTRSNHGSVVQSAFRTALRRFQFYSLSV